MWQTQSQSDGSVREVTCQCANELSSFFLPIVTLGAGQKDPLQRPATVIRMEHQWLKDRHDMKWSRFGIYSSKILVHVHGLYKRTNEGHQFCGMWKNPFPLVYLQGMQKRWDISRYFDILKGAFPNQRIITSEASTQQNHSPSEAEPWKWQASRFFHWMEGWGRTNMSRSNRCNMSQGAICIFGILMVT